MGLLLPHLFWPTKRKEAERRWSKSRESGKELETKREGTLVSAFFSWLCLDSRGKKVSEAEIREEKRGSQLLLLCVER